MEMREKVGKSRFTVFFRKRSRELFPEFGRLLLFYFFSGGWGGPLADYSFCFNSISLRNLFLIKFHELLGFWDF